MKNTKVIIRPSQDVTPRRIVNFLLRTHNQLILCDQRVFDMLGGEYESSSEDDSIIFRSLVRKQIGDVDGFCCLHRFESHTRWYFVFLSSQESLLAPGFVGRLTKPLDAQESDYWSRWLTALNADRLYEAFETDGVKEFCYDRDYLDPTDALADLVFDNMDLNHVEIETYEDLYS